MRKIATFVLMIVMTTFAYSETVWIDVRTAEEYQQDHIDGDLWIPHEQIVAGIEKRFPDKSTDLHLYCRSGRRAGIALSMLQEAGYVNVSNAGGIDDARNERSMSK